MRTKNQAGIELLNRWRKEDASMTDEEKDQADRNLGEFKRNINETRRMEGREPVYPDEKNLDPLLTPAADSR